MYEELFHSPDRPFRATPDSKFYFPHESIETARQTIVRAVMRAEGPVMVLGGAGLGKSLLGMVVAEDLGARFDVVKLHAARLCSRRALLQNILFELQLPYRDMTEGDLRLSILDRLELSPNHAPDGILVIVDEAHTLPAKLLDELRLITNFTRGNQPRVRLVLIGNLRLEHTFAEPQMESFNQRLAARCYLQPMNRQQTREYVRHQLSTAGVEPRGMITEEALGTVYAASEGVPRLSNQIMDHALVLAITRGQCPVSSALIEEAWADLQQLPAPWHAGADRLADSSGNVKTTGNAVEFGTLDDESNEEIEEPRIHSVNRPVSETSPHAAADRELSLADDSDADLRLADEALDAPIPAQQHSFFAAFAPLEDDSSYELELTLAEDSDSFDSQPAAGLPTASASAAQAPTRDAVEDFELLIRPRVVFDMQQARAQAQQFEEDGEHAELGFVPDAGNDSFFANRPTDERMLALQEEQREFDSMGVWDNDPPLSVNSHDHLRSFAAPGNRSRSVKDLFGDDFEEEVCLTSAKAKPTPRFAFMPHDAEQTSDPTAASPSARGQTVQFIDSAAAETTQQAVEAADYVARIQQFADAVTAGNKQVSSVPVPTVDEILASSPTNVYPDITFQSAFDTWSVDVATLDVENEVAVHDEIEDLVSQLNFAAFSVEPFSIEQIEIAPRDQRPQPPADSVRSGPRDEIYALHRPQELAEENVFNGWTADSQSSFDDDRDLLVVEEELPLTAKSANEAEPPVTKIAPYSQLFAKLRK